jgi:hypothetical protein
MSSRDSVAIVHSFWEEVWNGHDPSAVDKFVVDDLHLEVVESFQNVDGSRVASRWLLTGRNNGILGTRPDKQPVEMTGTAVWAVREDGKLLTNWVERSSWELCQRLTASE